MIWPAQVGTGFPSAMSFAQRVENVITYAVASLIDWVAFHRCDSPLSQGLKTPFSNSVHFKYHERPSSEPGPRSY